MSAFSKWDADEIVPNVWVGPLYCSEMIGQLYSRNIFYICSTTIPPPSLQAKIERDAAERLRHRQEQKIREERGEIELFRSMSIDDESDDGEYELKFCHVAVRDEPGEQLLPHFERVAQFIETALSKDKGVLVHCMAGVSRSPTFVAAWLIKCRGMSAADAVALVVKQRSSAQPRPEFVNQLIQWDRSCNHTSTCCLLT